MHIVNFTSSDSDDNYATTRGEKRKRRRVCDDKAKEVVSLDFLPKVDLSRVKIKKTEMVGFVMLSPHFFPSFADDQVAYAQYCDADLQR